MAYSALLTRLFFPGALIVRRPIFLRGRPRMHFGRGFACGYACRLETFGERNDKRIMLSFGENCHIGDYVHIAAGQSVRIGKNCLMASHVFITDLNHGEYGGDGSAPTSDPNSRDLSVRAVSIGDNVWIGENVCVLPGVNIGDGCVIGAGPIVTRDVPAGTIAVGSPARVIKDYVDNIGWQSASPSA